MNLIQLHEGNYLFYSGRNILLRKDNNYKVGKLHNFQWEDTDMNLHDVSFIEYKIYLLP